MICYLVNSWIVEQRNRLEMCMGVEPNCVEILIMSRNKNVATADRMTHSIVLSFSSTVVSLMACGIFSGKLKPSTDTFLTFTFA